VAYPRVGFEVILGCSATVSACVGGEEPWEERNPERGNSPFFYSDGLLGEGCSVRSCANLTRSGITTLPLAEEEPLNPSYAAAEGFGTVCFEFEDKANRKRRKAT
jgi:hypothetical protein